MESCTASTTGIPPEHQSLPGYHNWSAKATQEFRMPPETFGPVEKTLGNRQQHSSSFQAEPTFRATTETLRRSAPLLPPRRLLGAVWVFWNLLQQGKRSKGSLLDASCFFEPPPNKIKLCICASQKTALGIGGISGNLLNHGCYRQLSGSQRER